MAKDLKGSLDRAMSADEAIYIYTKFENWLGTEALQSVMLVTCWNEKAEFSVIRIYDTILQLTQALYFVEPRLTSKARKVAARLHLKMMKNGLMHSPFDQRYRRPTRSVAGSPLNADFSHVELYNIDEGRKTLQVPIFTQLLRVEKTPIYCIICAESIYNISYDAVDEWIEVSIEFDGDWVWKISRFPKILRARCKHTIDFCTSCLQKHIGSQLEQLKLCSKSLWTPHPVATQSIQQR
ncbi:hypothetical protein H9Q74_013832 [Fusarium xylarioides]|nr:hypothetical protein H9Q71_014209 [Fusarium xylarioides]KAG5810842.1 hypothetical protein H9Q74_013832 [Fusarium xylarioides]